MKCTFYLLMECVVLYTYKVISINYSGMECFHKLGEKKIVNCISSDDHEIKISADKITGDEGTEELGIHFGSLVWELDVSSFDIFSNFENLSTLIIKSKFVIKHDRSEDQYDAEFSKAKRNFIDKLFNLRKLKHLEVHNGHFTDEYNWTLPATLRYLAFPNSSYTKFDLRNQPMIARVNFEGNNLTRMPQFSSPPPPIVELNLYNNHFLEVTVDDIASVCRLTKLSLNTCNKHLSDDVKNCRCVQLKEWIELRGISEALKDEKCEDPPSECPKFAFDKAAEKYRKCLESTRANFEQDAHTTNPPRREPPESPHEPYQIWFSWLLIVIAILSILFILFLVYGVVTFVVQAQSDDMLDSDPAKIYDPYITEEDANE